jgi:hypothetical protein
VLENYEVLTRFDAMSEDAALAAPRAGNGPQLHETDND